MAELGDPGIPAQRQNLDEQLRQRFTMVRAKLADRVGSLTQNAVKMWL